MISSSGKRARRCARSVPVANAAARSRRYDSFCRDSPAPSSSGRGGGQELRRLRDAPAEQRTHAALDCTGGAAGELLIEHSTEEGAIDLASRSQRARTDAIDQRGQPRIRSPQVLDADVHDIGS